MKLFLPFFLAALIGSTTSNLLLAQCENSLEVTNQITGCRLKDRLEAGKTGKNLPGNITENYESPTANPNKNRDRRELLSEEEHQVTVKEYCDFLNAVATDDPHHFYEEWMGSDPETACILRSGTSGNYSYSVLNGKGGMSISEVNLLNQARYCNWLENGQPTGSQSQKATEDGVYIPITNEF